MYAACRIYASYPIYLIQVGKALFDGQLLDVHFTRSFYKHILGAKVTYHDIEAIDPAYFKNLKWLLEASAICGFESTLSTFLKIKNVICMFVTNIFFYLA